MAHHDPYADFKVVQSHKPDAWPSAAAELSAAIAVTGYRTATIVVNAGTVEATTTVDVLVTGATTAGGSHSNITGAAFTQITAANDVAVYMGRLNTADYAEIKVSMNVSVDAGDMSTCVILSNAKVSSTANTQWVVN